MANPNPDRITDEIWALWEAFEALEPGVELGGIYANKPGYHNTREANKTGDYSVRDAEDKLGPDDKAAAIDLTFPDAQAKPPNYTTIARYSKRLLDSGRDPKDPRGDYLREFFGNTDDDRDVEGWDFRYFQPSTSDSSHLWHIHISFSREHVANAAAMRALLSILKGETVAQWLAGQGQEGNMQRVAFDPATGWWIGDGIWRRAITEQQAKNWAEVGVAVDNPTADIDTYGADIATLGAGAPVLVPHIHTPGPAEPASGAPRAADA